MRKPGDIEVIYANPLTCIGKIGQARLVQKISEYDLTELWLVEYLEDEGSYYEAKLKRNDTQKEEG